MKNITHLLKEIYLPQKALLIHESVSDKSSVFVEAYDIDEVGKPFNAHPLSVSEMSALADCLNASKDLSNNFLISKNIFPENVLYINPLRLGCAIWYTNPQKVQLYFKPETGAPCGMASVPGLIWKATKNELIIYAIKSTGRPNGNTPLCYAPFFNIYKNGQVCMGTVDIEISKNCCLEEFISQWESYFWNSYFSHLLDNHSPVKTNIVQLWREQINTNNPFPTEVLIKIGKTLKAIVQ